MRLRVTPVPIPNTMVKTQAADGTILETVFLRFALPHDFASLCLRHCSTCVALVIRGMMI